MSHTVHPYSHRLGIIRGWKSRWFGFNKQYRDFLKGDVIIREFLAEKLRGLALGLVEIERGDKYLRIIVKTARPGMIIGRSGEGAVKLKNELVEELKRRKALGKEEIKLDIEEIKNPESNAHIVGQMVAEGLEKRMPFRRVMKQMVEKVMANRDVLGVKILLSGRLGGADMSRKEMLRKGRVPLQTFRADIDFSRFEARLSYGNIGIKTWIYKGEIFNKDKK
ncbi:30S ribosomal protein S3 [Candidatus Nomurabacteria bacterium]|nr:30S ribosomal protein S3 [Candidatus Nomurabacteria bacterium]